MSKKIAVILFNLGGPDKLDSVQQFLFNLFNDKHIITLPQPLRYIIAKIISKFRTKKSQNIYRQMGGKSSILDESTLQAIALEKYLNTHYAMHQKVIYDVIPMMRYWHPMTCEIIKQVSDQKYDNIILLPLYPHFSTTTTLSSLREWFKYAKNIPIANFICCYSHHPGYIDASVDIIKETLKQINTTKPIRLLFSAHSIPQHISDKGDPYQKQIIDSVNAIAAHIPNAQHTLCYQSKVGRMKWLEPDIKSELLAAGKRHEAVVVIPISFTSEHSETLVELDIEYAAVAQAHNIEYYRVPTLRSHPIFIQTLADLVIKKLAVQIPDLSKHINQNPYKNAKVTFHCNAALCCQKIQFNAY